MLPLVGGTAGSENVALLHDHFFVSSFAKFVAARKECADQFGGTDALAAAVELAALGAEALAVRCTRLRATQEACERLHLGEVKGVTRRSIL